MLIPTFAFLDESGNLDPGSPQRYFAVGAVIDSYPDDMIKELHNLFEGLCSALKKDPSRLEFRFSDVKKSSLSFYLKLIDIMKKYNSWRFCCLIIDKKDPKYSQPTHVQEIWECYLRYTKLLLQKNLNNNERTVLIADFLKQPKGKVHTLATMPQVVSQLVDTLQVESQGVLPVQVADVFLGGCLYSGKDVVKKRIAKKVKQLKKNIGKKRFNQWEVEWNFKW